jgi:hypothetical protein
MTRDEYIEKRRKVDLTEVEVGVFGISLFPPEELDEGQEGYAGEGWPEHWLVIASEVGAGDPVILDCESGKVLTAEHGQGSWEGEAVARSVDAFFAILKALDDIGMDDPDAEVSAEEHDRFMTAVKESDPDLDPWWWLSLIYAGEDPPADGRAGTG